MKINLILLPILAGAITSFLLGYLFYGIIFHDDFSNEIITKSAILINPPRLMFLFLGNAVAASLMTYVFVRLYLPKSKSEAFVIGFLIMGLAGLYDNLIIFGRTDMYMLSGIFIDAIIIAIMGAISSVVIFQLLKWLT